VTAPLSPLGGWLSQVEAFVRQFVVLSDDQAAAVVLWAAHTHAFEAATATPYLSISSAEMESGKTRLLEVLRLLVANPWFTGRTTTAALTRKIDRAAPALLLDEGDPAFAGDKDYAEALRGVLNTGYRRGGAVTVCIGQGAALDVRDFSTFCPKAIAGIGRLPDTVQSRSIPIRLKKRLGSEPIERFRERKARAGGETLADGLAISLEPLVEELTAAEPDLPDELSDRAQDVWEPLLAIADAAGGEWPERARGAAVRLSNRSEADEATLGVRLLADIRDAFEGVDRLSSRELLEHLHGLDEAPWGDWYGKPLSARTLAKFLRPFEIKSRVIRVAYKTPHGFSREQFEDAWERYLSPIGDSQPQQRNNGLNKPETPGSETQQAPPMLRIENPDKPLEQAVVAHVADRNGGKGDNGPSDGPCVCRIPDFIRDDDGTWRCRRCLLEPAA
jgi:hypothetical protein